MDCVEGEIRCKNIAMVSLDCGILKLCWRILNNMCTLEKVSFFLLGKGIGGGGAVSNIELLKSNKGRSLMHFFREVVLMN